MERRPFILFVLLLILSSCVGREFDNPFDPQVPKRLVTTISPRDSGEILISPESSTYQTNEIVSLIPEPNRGWVFKNWSGDESGQSVPLSITMDTNKSISAIFIRKTYPLNITIEGGGSVNETIISNPSGREYPDGTVVRLTAIPESGWMFDSWREDLMGNQSPRDILIDAEKNIKAIFRRQLIASLNCQSPINNGTIVSGRPTSGVNSIISYSGGIASPHNGQIVQSSGVTGLTATLNPGNFVNGDGTLTYTITGTPSQPGTANFSINIGDQSCVFNRQVIPVGSISTLNCTSPENTGDLSAGEVATSVTTIISYTGGNGGIHDGQIVESSGITGLTATLQAGNFANGTGTLVYTITGTPLQGGTARFAINIGGRSCEITRTVNALSGTISSLNCSAVSNSGDLIAGQSANEVVSIVPYTGGNGGTHAGQTVQSTGVTGLTATLESGNFASGSGELVFTITGTPSTAGTARFLLNIGGSACEITRTINSSQPTFTDPRDGNVYRIITIGPQTWFAENLRFIGTIPQVSSQISWGSIWNDGNPTYQPAWAYYNNDQNNNQTHGKLYNWYAVNTRTLCPPGWRIPDQIDWIVLISNLGGFNVAGGKIKTITDWKSPNTGATNESGFSAQPSGIRTFQGAFFDLGIQSFWWSLDEINQQEGGTWGVAYDSSELIIARAEKNFGLSCRCIREQ
jgi:uncharacterized protein (TIGR02145 family)